MVLLSLSSLVFKFLGLFVVSDFLKTEKVFTRLLIKFTINEVDDIFDLRDLDEFKSVDSSVCNFKS